MDNINSNIFQNIKEFISDFAGVRMSRITINSRLENDLKIYGDDSIELITAYSKKFNVDITNFNFKNFVRPEGDTLLPLLKKLFINSKEVQRNDLTVFNLVNGVTEGRLDFEIINRQHSI